MSDRLRIDDVAWRIGDRDVLSGVTLAVAEGELVAILGRNGAGKSTLLNIVAGLRAPTRGSVAVDGRAIGAWSSKSLAQVVTHLPQSVRPDLPFLAGELVLMGRYPHTDRWFESDADRSAVERAMRRTDCWNLRDRSIATLSGGERQRVLLAACFAQDPKLLLLDEPSTHLDVDQQLHCFSMLKEAAAEGAACVAVTHDLNLALSYATRIVVIAGGRVAVDLAAAEAAKTAEWLSLFSARLTLSADSGGRAWVSYT
jgi:ABC-type cobalamin/Fe3+-siderophores transport system ATPase subunit